MELNKNQQTIKLIIALGNPGPHYVNSRHNAGFLFAQELISHIQVSQSGLQAEHKSFELYDQYSFSDQELIIVLPKTFMNNSGDAVKRVIKKEFGKLHTQEILLVHDDLDISLGKYKLDLAKSPKGHKGIISVENNLATDQFWRLRIGVENRDKQQRIQILGPDYVLQQFSEEEMKIIKNLYKQIIATELF